MVVAGAMLYSGSVAGLRIPKSPSFHSGLDLAAEKDYKFVTTSHSTGSFTDMPSLQQPQQQQDQSANSTNNKVRRHAIRIKWLVLSFFRLFIHKSSAHMYITFLFIVIGVILILTIVFL